MSGIDGERPFIPDEASILRIARTINDSMGGLWEFGMEYAVLNAQPKFNYTALARAVKDQHGLDLYPPSVASKLRRAYETYVMRCRIPLEDVRHLSPYYLYELSTIVDVTPQNAREWINKASSNTRDDLFTQVKAGADGARPKESMAMLRLPENVFQSLEEARAYLGASVGVKDLSRTVFMEFITELITNTQGTQLKRLWNLMHGEDE